MLTRLILNITKLNLISFLKKIFGDGEKRIFLTFLFITVLFFTISGWSAMAVLALFFLATLFINFGIKSWLVSFFVVALFVMPFFEPNKYYVIEVIRSFERVPDINLRFKMGYFIGYGLTIPNIFTLATFGFLIREVLLGKLKIKFPKSIVIAGFCALMFTGISLYTSVYNSQFPELSIVWLLQYLQCFILAFIIYYVFVYKRAFFKFVYIALFASLLFQSLIGLLQFFRQSSLGLPVEYVKSSSVFFTGLDEIDSLFRISGTLVQPNQMALIVTSLFILCFPMLTGRGQKLFLLGVISALVLVILSQSRTVWVVWVVMGFLIIKFVGSKLRLVVFGVGLRKIFYYCVSVVLILIPILVPRVLLSSNSIYEGAGIPIRLKMIREGLEALSASPAVGYGIGTNESVLYTMFPDGVMSAFPAPVHLGYLQMALEVGILGTLLFLTLFLIVLRSVIVMRLRDLSYVKLYSDYNFVFIGGITLFGIYYLMHPYAGIIEFPYLGLHLGFGLVSVYLGGKRHGKYN